MRSFLAAMAVIVAASPFLAASASARPIHHRHHRHHVVHHVVHHAHHR
jgi:hypothetical protein